MGLRQLQDRGDVLDWFPGTSTVYFRLPWCLLEPQEGQYRWDLFDSYAAPWIAAGKQIGLRLTCCESRYPFATPEWVKNAGAQGWFFKMTMAKVFGREPPGSGVDIWEPDYGDPVFLAKLENFLKAMAKRYDGKPYVAFMDVGTIGMWGEGHTRAYTKELLAQGRDPEEAFHRHYELHRRIFPNTTLLAIDDQAGAWNPAPDAPLMHHARELVERTSVCTFGWTGEIPQINDGVWVYTQAKGIGNYATDTRVPTLTPGTYTLCVSLGEPDGTPVLTLPLKNGKDRRYPIGPITVK